MTIGRQLLSFALGLILLAFAAWLAVQIRSGALDAMLSAPQLTIAPATAPAARPFNAAPQPSGAAPAEWHPPLVAPQPQAPPAQVAPAAPAEAVPAGAPMTEEYKATIQQQQRTNGKGEFCAPRSGCTKPGSGGPQPGPVGEQP